MKNIMSIQTGNPLIQTYLTTKFLPASSIVSLDEDSTLVHSNNDYPHIIGITAKSQELVNTLINVPVYVSGIVTGEWHFDYIGKPVYVVDNTATQDISSLTDSDYILEIGIAYTSNQIQLHIRVRISHRNIFF